MAVDATVYHVRHLSIPSYSLDLSEWGECCATEWNRLLATDSSALSWRALAVPGSIRVARSCYHELNWCRLPVSGDDNPG